MVVQWAVAAATDGQCDGQLRSRLRNRFGASVTFLQSVGKYRGFLAQFFPRTAGMALRVSAAQRESNIVLEGGERM